MTDIVVKSKCLKLKWVSFLYIHYSRYFVTVCYVNGSQVNGHLPFLSACHCGWLLFKIFILFFALVNKILSLSFSLIAVHHIALLLITTTYFTPTWALGNALWPRNLEVKSRASINSFILFFWSKTNELSIESAFKSTYGYFLTVRRGVRSSLQTTSSSMQTAGFHRR